MEVENEHDFLRIPARLDLEERRSEADDACSKCDSGAVVDAETQTFCPVMNACVQTDADDELLRALNSDYKAADGSLRSRVLDCLRHKPDRDGDWIHLRNLVLQLVCSHSSVGQREEDFPCDRSSLSFADEFSGQRGSLALEALQKFKTEIHSRRRAFLRGA